MARALYRELCAKTTDGADTTSVQELIDQHVLQVGDGYRAKNSELGSTGIPFARAGNIDAGFMFDEADLLAEENIPKAGAKVSQPGDVVFTSKGTVGRFALVRKQTPRFAYSPQLCFWRTLQPKKLSVSFLFRWMQSREFLEQVDRVKGSTDMADYVSLTNQRRMTIRLPSVKTQRVLGEHLDPIEELVGTLVEQRARLRESRDLLLPRLLSGQLELSEAA